MREDDWTLACLTLPVVGGQPVAVNVSNNELDIALDSRSESGAGCCFMLRSIPVANNCVSSGESWAHSAAVQVPFAA